MRTQFNIMKSSKHFIPAILVSSLLSLGMQAAETGEKEVAATASPAQKTFETPEQAAAGLIEAAAAFELPALREILGPDSDDIIASEDPVMDKERAVAFAAKAKEKQTVEIDPENPDLAVLSVGEDAFPLHDPVVPGEPAA